MEVWFRATLTLTVYHFPLILDFVIPLLTSSCPQTLLPFLYHMTPLLMSLINSLVQYSNPFLPECVCFPVCHLACSLFLIFAFCFWVLAIKKPKPFSGVARFTAAPERIRSCLGIGHWENCIVLLQQDSG